MTDEIPREILLLAHAVRSATTPATDSVADNAEFWIPFILSAAATLSELKRTNPELAEQALAKFDLVPTAPSPQSEGWFVPDA